MSQHTHPVIGAAPSGALRPALLLLVAITAVNPLALNLYVPSMPSVQSEFDAIAASVQLTLSLGLVGTALIQLVLGPLSDRLGRRPVLLGGLLISTLASFYCGISQDMTGLIIGRVLQVAGGAAGLVLGRAIVRDLHEPNKAASMLGYVTMGMAMVPMVAPTIGGFLDDLWSWRAGFHFTGLVSLFTLIAAWYSLPETNQNIGKSASPRQILRDYKTLSGMRAFWIYSAAAAFTSGTFFTFLGGAPFVSRDVFDIGPTEYGLYFILAALGYAIGNYFSGRYTALYGIVKMMLAGGAITLASCLFVVVLSLLGIENPMTLFGAMLVMGIGNGMTLPSATVGVVSVLPKLAGTASGLSGSLMTLVGATFSYLVAFLLSDSLLPMALLMTLSATIALVSGLMAPDAQEMER